MATLDFTPLFRSTVGFDRVPTLLSHAMQREEGGYPPYNIEKCGDDAYRIVMALAGFGKDDVEIVAEQNRLTVRGEIKDKNGRTYLHHGIATRAFERHFELADFVEVVGASMGDGLLIIEFKREIPEELKPRRIEIEDGMFTRLEPKSVAAKAPRDSEQSLAGRPWCEGRGDDVRGGPSVSCARRATSDTWSPQATRSQQLPVGGIRQHLAAVTVGTQAGRHRAIPVPRK